MAMDWGVIARAVHVLAVVVWIGGLARDHRSAPGHARPAAGTMGPGVRRARAPFAPQARIAALLVLLSGLYMLYRYDLWQRFALAEYWWMDLMIGVWLLFAALLFVIEPLTLGRLVRRRAARAPETVLALMLWPHRGMLILSLAAVFAAVGGSYGLF